MDTPQITNDRRVEIAIHNWAPRFVANGVPLTDFREVTAQISNWDDWCAAWSARAAVHEALGHEALDGGHSLSAGEHLARAAVCYHFGKFMFVHDIQQMRAAHMKAVECRNLALPFLRPSGERVAISYEGKELIGILRKPQDVVCPPVVVMCVGLDSTKEEMDSYENTFLARGMATLSFDGPGQGEAEYEMPIRGDYEVAVKAVIDWIEQRNDVNAANIGIWGVSLGGYYAPRAAAFEKRIKACISLSGPYDWAEIFENRNELSREAFRVRSHSRTMDEARRRAESLTLKGVAGNIECPLYVVAGGLDHLTPPHNGERLAREASGPVEFLLIKDATHTASNRGYRFRTQTADWMADRLGAAIHR